MRAHNSTIKKYVNLLIKIDMLHLPIGIFKILNHKQMKYYSRNYCSQP